MNLSFEEETINDNFLSTTGDIFQMKDIPYQKTNYRFNNNCINSDVSNSVVDASRPYEIFLHKEKDEDDNQYQKNMITNGIDYYEYYSKLYMNKHSSKNNIWENEMEKNNFLNKKRNHEKIFAITKEFKKEKINS